MKKRIIDYRKRIDDILLQNASDTEWEKVLEEHVTQIAFFQHERLIHLIVTALVALITVLVLGLMVISSSIFLGIAALLLFVLLFAYILHYFTLENEVQKMYGQYDRLRKETESSQGK